MKLLMIVADSELSKEIEAALDGADVSGYTEFPTVLGKGATGRKMGTRAFPGTGAMYLVAVVPTKADAIVDELAKLERNFPGNGLSVHCFGTTRLL